MLLPEREKRILKDLIGRKLDAVMIPDHAAALPVELYLVLSDQIIKVDSCWRAQQPTETARYPQFRLTTSRRLPDFIRLKSLPLGDEIVMSVEFLDEQYQSPKDFIIYTKGFKICCSNDQEICVLRKSYRDAGLKVSLSDLLKEEEERQSDYLHYDHRQF